MDEPLASLDAARREEIMSLIERIRDELLLPILYVSHDRSEVERLADQIIPIQPGNTDLYTPNVGESVQRRFTGMSYLRIA